jgi:hypothetical protein
VNTAQRLDDLAISVCQTIRDLRKEHQAWISIDSLHDRMGLENLRTVDAAVAFARAKGWVAIGGAPAHSVLLKQGAP